jgi:oxygen-independent coproporphyrinogen-3 oxidase
MDVVSIYVHIPFCLHRCVYCDFNTYAGQNDLIPEYVDALQHEIAYLKDAAERRFKVKTIYFGGGTPSLLPAPLISKILNKLDACFEFIPDVEISLEANPGTLSLSYLRDLSAIGINRVSLGVQSAHPRELAILERQHCFDDVIESVKWTRQAGIDNLSLDLIFGLPDQPLEIWNVTLTQTLNLDPEHFSLYSLSIEEDTLLHSWVSRGLISFPDSDLAAEMYELASEKLSSAGYLQYEISNWAKGKQRQQERNSFSGNKFGNLAPYWACRHNLQYWRNQPYLGFGAGAHGFIKGFRVSNILTPLGYINRLNQKDFLLSFPQTPATVGVVPINRSTEIGETMMMGLRLTSEGVSRTAFQTRFGQDFYELYAQQIKKLINSGLLEWAEPREDILRLTPRGRLLGNQVFSEFI